VTQAGENQANLMLIRPAKLEEAEALTRLTLTSKRYWGYSEAQMRAWEPQLTVSADYISNNLVLVAELDSLLCGYASRMQEPEDALFQIGSREIRGGCYLDNLFVLPQYMHRGIGRALLREMLRISRLEQILNLYIVSDPNARAFYERMGASYLGDTPASETARALPVLEIACGLNPK
jgi:GNAT superfamily N-acetyltransferase